MGESPVPARPYKICRLGEASAKTGFAVHAYCLMKNHYCQTARLEEGP
jgi:hypothetical protein